MTEIIILADESGHRFGSAKEIVEAINDYLNDLAQYRPDVFVSLYTFNSATRLYARFLKTLALDTPRLFRNIDLFVNPHFDIRLLYAPKGAQMSIFSPNVLTYRTGFGIIET